VPFAWKTASKDRVKFDPRSRIRNRKFSNPLAEGEGEVAGPAARPIRQRGSR
jgi:hypothetical protein